MLWCVGKGENNQKRGHEDSDFEDKEHQPPSKKTEQSVFTKGTSKGIRDGAKKET